VLEVGGPGPASARGLTQVDITDAAAVKKLMTELRPDGVIHLAGFSSVARSHQQPEGAFSVNTMGTVHLLTAVRDVVPGARVVLVGSGEVYGPVSSGVKADESHPLRPTSPYAASKVAAEIVAGLFHRTYGLEVVLARPFNHLGSGQDARFVVPSLAAQLRAIARGEAEPILRVGNLEPIRDFSHVRDVTRAYRVLLEHGVAGRAYNICSGEGRSIRRLVQEMSELAGVEVTLELDPARLRPSDLPCLVGDPTALEALGWKRERTVIEALQDVLSG